MKTGEEEEEGGGGGGGHFSASFYYSLPCFTGPEVSRDLCAPCKGKETAVVFKKHRRQETRAAAERQTEKEEGEEAHDSQVHSVNL